MSDLKPITKNWGITKREFKSMKRKELREVIKLIHAELLSGAAYLPGDDVVFRCLMDLEKLQDEMSVKKWGR